jgi:hypothetical protein
MKDMSGPNTHPDRLHKPQKGSAVAVDGLFLACGSLWERPDGFPADFNNSKGFLAICSGLSPPHC